MRERILEAAVRLFSRRSYPEVSVQDVAREAGVSKGALFHYFRSKLDLAEEALRALLARLAMAPLLRAARSGGSLEARVGRLVDAVLDHSLVEGLRGITFLLSVYEELRRRGREGFVKEFYREARGVLAGMLRELGVPNPELRARLLSMMLDGLYVHAVVDPDSFRDPGFVEELKAEMARVLGCRT